MSIYHFIIILVLYSSKVVLSRKVKVSEALRNKHLTVIAEEWVPFLTYDWHRNEMGNYEIRNYGGIIVYDWGSYPGGEDGVLYVMFAATHTHYT